MCPCELPWSCVEAAGEVLEATSALSCCFCFEFGDSRPKPLNAVFNLAPFFIGKRQTSADGPTQFVISFLDGWRGRTFLRFFWRRAICGKNHTTGQPGQPQYFFPPLGLSFFFGPAGQSAETGIFFSQFTAAAAGSALCTICYYLLLPLALLLSPLPLPLLS